jgi:cell division initiation protein
MLTASDVEKKTFSTALRGYDLDEVDDFLDEIVATIRELSEQLDEARATAPPITLQPAAPAEPEAVPARETMPEPRAEIDESAVGRALIAAQNAADKLLEDAQVEAAKLLDGAKDEADSFQAERDEKKMEAEAEIAAIAARVASVRTEISVLADEVSERLDDMDAVIDDSGVAAHGDHEARDDGDSPDPFDDSPADDGDDQYESDGTEDGGGDDAAEEGSEKEVSNDQGLDAMLTGVASDLQLVSDDDTDSDEDDDE